MQRRPIDRRSFRDACAAARLRKWPPENVSVAASLRELIVGRLTSSRVDYVQEMVLLWHIQIASITACQALVGHPGTAESSADQ